MENQNISEIALQKIKESGIKPISKNIFNIKRVLFWSFVGTSLIVGAVSFSITLSLLLNNDWDLYNKFGFNFIFKSLPYFWFASLVIFTFLGEFYYRKTLVGYRHRVVTIIGIYIMSSIFFGSILYLFGTGEIIEQTLSENVPVYRGFMFDKNEFWSHPDLGLISGTIVSVEGNVVKIVDLNNDTWSINVGNANIGAKAKIKKGEIIKVIGDIDSDSVFTATQIRPWIGNRFGKNGKNKNIVR